MNYLRRHMYWQSKRLHWEGVPGPRAAGWGKPGELLCHMAHHLGYYGDGVSVQVVSDQSLWLRFFLVVHASPSQEGLQRGCREVGGTYGLASPFSLWPFLNYSSCRHFVISVFLTKTSCCKITLTSGYSHAWSGLVVSVTGFPNNV